MIDMLLLALFNALAIIGIFEATRFGKVLHSTSKVLEKALPNFLYNPLLGCVVCMSSFYGSVLFVYTYQTISFLLLFYIPCLSAITAFLYELLLLIRTKRN